MTAVNHEAVRAFLTRVHQSAQAAFAGVNSKGFMQLVRIHPSVANDVGVFRFAVGDVNGMVEQAVSDALAGYNVYVEGRTVKAGLARGSRGSAFDTVGVFALVVDSDDDKGKGAVAGLPPASMVVESSPGNAHLWYFLDKAMPIGTATPLGERLRAASGADSASGKITQPYRVAGTPNFPNKEKLARGRSISETSILQDDGTFYTESDFSAVLPELPKRDAPSSAAADGEVIETSIAEIKELLSYIPADCAYEEWTQVMMAIHHGTGGSGDGLDLADEWSAQGSKYKGRKEIEAKWRSFKRGGVTMRTLADLASRCGADISEIYHRHHAPSAETLAEWKEAADRVFQGFLEKRASTQEKIEDEGADDEGHGIGDNDDWTNPGGLIGDIADWIVETSPSPNRRLALAAAIAFVSLVCSRHRETPDFCGGLQLFTICTGQTGIGKDWPLKAIDRLAIEAGIQMLVRSGKVTTSLAIESEIMKKATSLIVADEVGRRIFGKAGNKRAGTYESSIIDTLLELWSSSPAGFFRTTSRVDREAAIVEGPAVSLFGVSTHRDFYTSLGRASIDNGMINRLLIIEADKRSALRSIDGAAARNPPSHIIDAIQDLKPHFDGTPSSGIQAYIIDRGVKANPVPWANDSVKDQWHAFRVEMLSLSDRNEETAPFVSRSAEIALRLACIHALSRFGPSAVIMKESVSWGISVARESAKNAVYGADEYIVTSDFQEHVKRVEKIIRSKGVIPKSIIARKLGGVIDNRTLENVIGHLILAGKISEVDSQRKGSYRWMA